MADFLKKETVSEDTAPSLKEVCSFLSGEVKKYSQIMG